MEGWPEYIYSMMDGNNSDVGPIKDNLRYVRYLVILFILVGSIFCINLFVAMISMKFDEA